LPKISVREKGTATGATGIDAARRPRAAGLALGNLRVRDSVPVVYGVLAGIKGLCEASYQRYATVPKNVPE
jgi:hypothetical protein